MSDSSKKPIVVTNGCFDILHIGHIKLIQYAAKLGDLIILINDDESIRVLKGEHKPYIPVKDRVEILMAIKGVKSVLPFSSQSELYRLYEWLTPDFIVIGDEYKGKPVVGIEFAKKVIYFPKIRGCSSSLIAERIKNENRSII